MITKEQAYDYSLFHHNEYKNADGTCMRWRANGAVKTWKRNLNRFRLPLQRGLYQHTYLTDETANEFHLPENCPDVR
jgi:hypothetical protein